MQDDRRFSTNQPSEASIYVNMRDSRCSSFKFRIFMYLILVISVAHFSPEAPGFVVKSISSNFLELLYLLLCAILVIYSLISRKGLVGKNVEMEMNLGFNASIDYVEEMLLNVECMQDFEYYTSSYGDSCGGCVNAEWLGLPIRSLKSVVDEGKGVKCGYNGLNEKGDFSELQPMNLLEKFNEASDLFGGSVAGSCSMKHCSRVHLISVANMQALKKALW